jgi:hypothetical protein
VEGAAERERNGASLSEQPEGTARRRRATASANNASAVERAAERERNGASLSEQPEGTARQRRAAASAKKWRRRELQPRSGSLRKLSETRFWPQTADRDNFRRHHRVLVKPLSSPEIDPLFGAMVEAPGTGFAGRLPAPRRAQRRVGGNVPGAFPMAPVSVLHGVSELTSRLRVATITYRAKRDSSVD